VPVHAVEFDVSCNIVPALHTLKSKYRARISIAEGIGEFPNLLLGFAWGYEYHVTLRLVSQKVGCRATVTVVVEKRWRTASKR
jgi:hypothetical protein